MQVPTQTLSQCLNDAEKTYLENMLKHCTSHKSLAAQADISLTTLWRKLKRHELKDGRSQTADT